MNKEALIRKWKKDEKESFEGWDFSYLKGRVKESNPPWDYVKIARNLAKRSTKLLDIDTGGGEILLKIGNIPRGSYAVEGYKPNVKIARDNLRKAGIKVIEADSAHKLPFRDESFDLILNRHGAINAKEICRVLKKEGTFFTQQVDSKKNLVDLIRAFNGRPKWIFNNLQYRKNELNRLGLVVVRSQNRIGKIIFKDVGAVVYFLKSIPWLVNDFSVDSKLKYLLKLQNTLEKKGVLEFTLSNFLILAKKTAN